MDGGAWATQYDEFAEAFEAHAVDSAFNAYYDRPAVLNLLGDVAGKRVLDAGCGPGIYAEELVGGGAIVTGIDASAEMVRLASRRLAQGRSGRASFRQQDLNRPLDWLPDASFDLVVMALVIDHVHDRVGALRELNRVLAPGGRLVVSCGHPTADWLQSEGNYFDVATVDLTWSTGWHVRYWRLPMERRSAEFAEAGFVIERLVEPRPVPAMKDRYPKEYDRLMREPYFLVFRLAKAP